MMMMIVVVPMVMMLMIMVMMLMIVPMVVMLVIVPMVVMLVIVPMVMMLMVVPMVVILMVVPMVVMLMVVPMVVMLMIVPMVMMLVVVPMVVMLMIVPMVKMLMVVPMVVMMVVFVPPLPRLRRFDIRPVLSLRVELRHHRLRVYTKQRIERHVAPLSLMYITERIHRAHQTLNSLRLLGLVVAEHIHLGEDYRVGHLHLLDKQLNNWPLSSAQIACSFHCEESVVVGCVDASDKFVQLDLLHERCTVFLGLFEVLSNSSWLSNAAALNHDMVVGVSSLFRQRQQSVD